MPDFSRWICLPLVAALATTPLSQAQTIAASASEPVPRQATPAQIGAQDGAPLPHPAPPEKVTPGDAPAAVPFGPLFSGLDGPLARSTPAMVAIARAKGVLPSARTIGIVARAAEPTRLTSESQPGAAALSASQVIAQLCGSVRPEYVKAFKDENNLASFDLAAPLGDDAFRLAFPACLYADVNTAKRKNYTVLAEDTKSDILRLFTGSWTVDSRLTSYMTQSFGRSVPDGALPPGEQIAVPYITRPTVLVARSKKVDERVTFATALGTELGSDVAVDPVVVGGEIIGSPKLKVGGTTAADDEFPDCVNDDRPTYPFSGASVASAYRLSRDLLEGEFGGSRQMVRLVIVDNGFFGVPCSDATHCPPIKDGHLVFSERFPQRNFDFDKFPIGTLGPVGGNAIQPINYKNGLLFADDVSGHGTHVAGIAIGGPRFVPQRDTFDQNKTSWLKLVIANLAAGQKTFPVGVDEQILLAVAKIDGPKIVNLSLTVDGDVRPSVGTVMRRALSGEQANSLFIAAAGNSGANLSGSALYPAAYGGANGSMPNLISVASIDSDGHLSKFSNWGAKATDMAAPGCKIASWIDTSQPEHRQSGTSQAAPLVAFTAAMLRSIWERPPAMLKSRILYSGSLIADPVERGHVDSGVQLDAAVAILVRHDVVTFENPPAALGAAPTRVTLVGKLSVPLQGFRCDDKAKLPKSASKIRSFKREGDQAVLYWRLDDEARNASCQAALETAFGPVANELVFAPTHRLDLDGLTPFTQLQHIPVGQLRSIVYAEPPAIVD